MSPRSDGVSPVFPEFPQQRKMLAPQTPDGLQVLVVHDGDQVEVLDLLPTPFEVRQNDEALKSDQEQYQNMSKSLD